MTADDRRRLDRIQALWDELATIPLSAYRTPKYRALVVQIRQEVEAARALGLTEYDLTGPKVTTP